MSTLYLHDFSTSASLSNHKVFISKQEEDGNCRSLAVPLFNVERVVCIGKPHLTMPLLHELMYMNIPVIFLSSSGRWLGSLISNGNADRRIKQYNVANDLRMKCKIAKVLIEAKIHNMRRVLQRLAANRNLSASPEQKKTDAILKILLVKLQQQASLLTIRGIEGTASAAYFNQLKNFFPEDFPFNGRSAHPPRDAVNALLSWTYTIIATEIENTIRTVGLDPCLGFLHEISYGRPSLAYDLIEPLRAPLGDMLVMNMLSHGIIKPDMFEENQEKNAVYLKYEAKKIFFTQYEAYMQRQFKPYRQKRRTNYRQIIRDMVQNIANVCIDDNVNFFLMP